VFDSKNPIVVEVVVRLQNFSEQEQKQSIAFLQSMKTPNAFNKARRFLIKLEDRFQWASGVVRWLVDALFTIEFRAR
jgi:hypothetical protein